MFWYLYLITIFRCNYLFHVIFPNCSEQYKTRIILRYHTWNSRLLISFAINFAIVAVIVFSKFSCQCNVTNCNVVLPEIFAVFKKRGIYCLKLKFTRNACSLFIHKARETKYLFPFFTLSKVPQASVRDFFTQYNTIWNSRVYFRNSLTYCVFPVRSLNV